MFKKCEIIATERWGDYSRGCESVHKMKFAFARRGRRKSQNRALLYICVLCEITRFRVEAMVKNCVQRDGIDRN